MTATTQKRIASLEDELIFFNARYQKRLDELSSRSSEVDDEDKKTLIMMELRDYMFTEPSTIFHKTYQMDAADQAAYIEQLSTILDPHDEIKNLFSVYGILNVLKVINSLDAKHKRACIRALVDVILDFQKKQL